MNKSIILSALLLLAPVVSRAESLEDLLVQKGVITKGEAKGTTSAAPAKVYWNQGTRVDFPDNGFTLGVNTLLQTRYTFTETPKSAANTSSFDVTKARLVLHGTALHEEFEYHLENEFSSGAVGGGKSSQLLDAYLTWKACDYASVKAGQFKTGISREFNANDYALQFADRSIASNYFNLGRQSGAKATAIVGDGVTVGAGIFNGLSAGEGINAGGVDTKHTGIVDVRADVLGKQDVYTEGDGDTTQDLALNVGAAYAYSEANPAGPSKPSDSQHTVSVDADLKAQGFSFNGEFYYDRAEPDVGENINTSGGLVQAGYFVEPKTVELAARYSVINCDKGKASGICAGNDHVQEATAGVNYYFWKHNLKAQLNYDYVKQTGKGSESSDLNTNRWLVQLSSYF